MKHAVEINQLSKVFDGPSGWRRFARVKPVTAVSDVTLKVNYGELFGLLGPNGAGKTTLVKMLCTLVRPTSGSAIVGGHDLRESDAIRAAVGLVVSDERSFYWRLTAWQNLRFFSALHKLPRKWAEKRIHEVLQAVQLSHVAERPFNTFSTGMKQRLAIARSLLHQPEILFMDEPSRSLDPIATEQLHELITSLLQKQQVTIFLITHDLAEAQKLCHRVAVMHQGHIQAVGSPESLQQQLHPQIAYAVKTDPLTEPILKTLRIVIPGLQVETLTDYCWLHFKVQALSQRLNELLDYLRVNSLSVYQIRSEPVSLEEVFRHHTGEETEA